MKSTFLIKDELYALLVEEAKTSYGSVRKLSQVLNNILGRYFGRKKDLFGTTRPFDLSHLRDKRDRFT